MEVYCLLTSYNDSRNTHHAAHYKNITDTHEFMYDAMYIHLKVPKDMSYSELDSSTASR